MDGPGGGALGALFPMAQHQPAHISVPGTRDGLPIFDTFSNLEVLAQSERGHWA